ncbi:thiamine pyrophosphate-dependent enzyme [Chloroflexota bacterium]
MNTQVQEDEYIYSGHVGCPGCGAVLAMRYTLKALGKQTMIAMAASCWSSIAGAFPNTSLKLPVLHCAFATAAITAAAIKAGLEMKGDRETTALAWAGDGGTFDIGMQSLSGVAERNDNIIYVCYDNEAYMNTGIQRSSASPLHVWTTTTPATSPKNTRKKDLIGIMVAHRVPYAATASVAYPQDLVTKVKKAKEIEGTKIIHILSPCPIGWKYPSELTIKIARLAVQTKVFPLYEVDNGRYHITVTPDHIPTTNYIRLQSRFDHLGEENLEEVQSSVDIEWEKLLRRVSATSEFG